MNIPVRDIAKRVVLPGALLFAALTLAQRGAIMDAYFETHGNPSPSTPPVVKTSQSRSDQERENAAGLYINKRLYGPGKGQRYEYGGTLANIVFEFKVESPEPPKEISLVVDGRPLAFAWVSRRAEETVGSAVLTDLTQKGNYQAGFFVTYGDGRRSTIEVEIRPEQKKP